ncbi:oligosaccharide flippase family protein [bacterium]|nr:oligosaccharide flippase family protein [bacterium]
MVEYIKNQEEEDNQLRGIFKDMLKYSPSKLIGMIGNAIVIPVYTNLLLPEQYGLYSLSIAFLSFLCIIFSDWVGLSGLRFFRKAQLADDLSEYLSTLIVILTVNICTMFTLCAIFQSNAIEFFKVKPIYFWAVLFLIIPVAIRALLFQLLRAQIKPIAYTCSTIFNQFLTIGLSILFITKFHFGAMSLLLAMGISISFTDLILMVQSNIFKFFKKPKLSWGVLFPIILYGIPLSASSLSGWIINHSNKVVMNSIKGFTDVAFVGVAYGATMSILMTIFSIFTVAAIPRIYRMYEAKIDVRPIVGRFTGYFLVAALPIVTVMALYPQDVLILLNTNTKFMNASILVPYFVFGTMFLALTDYTTLQYHLANKTWITFIIKLLSGISNVLLTLYLVPKFGLQGVGIAMLTSNFIFYILSSIIRLPNLGLIIPGRHLLVIALAFLPSYAVYKIINIGCGVFSHSWVQMVTLLIAYYSFYLIVKKIFVKPKNA